MERSQAAVLRAVGQWSLSQPVPRLDTPRALCSRPPSLDRLRPRGRARPLTAPPGRVPQIFPGLILSDIKPAKRMRFRTVCYLLVQLMHCRRVFKAEVPFSNVMTCEDDDKVRAAASRLP